MNAVIMFSTLWRIQCHMLVVGHASVLSNSEKIFNNTISCLILHNSCSSVSRAWHNLSK